MRKINMEDVFKMARLLKNGNITQSIKDGFAVGKEKDADVEQVGLNIIMDIMCSCSDAKVEGQFYELLAGITEKTAQDIKTQSLETTVADFKKICEENNVVNFLKLAANTSGKIQK